ncbi:hypothetical protein HDV00_002440 [Rhizophlyctis rosea]|nr:hypothetical protein HDV00_002440 [Rhizophlyctis rosea]
MNPDGTPIQKPASSAFAYGYDSAPAGHTVVNPYSTSPPRGLDYLGAPVQTFYQQPGAGSTKSWGNDISSQWRPADSSSNLATSPAGSTAHLLASSPPQSKSGSSWGQGGYLSRAGSKSSLKDAVLAAGNHPYGVDYHEMAQFDDKSNKSSYHSDSGLGASAASYPVPPLPHIGDPMPSGHMRNGSNTSVHLAGSAGSSGGKGKSYLPAMTPPPPIRAYEYEEGDSIEAAPPTPPTPPTAQSGNSSTIHMGPTGVDLESLYTMSERGSSFETERGSNGQGQGYMNHNNARNIQLQDVGIRNSAIGGAGVSRRGDFRSTRQPQPTYVAPKPSTYSPYEDLYTPTITVGPGTDYLHAKDSPPSPGAAGQYASGGGYGQGRMMGQTREPHPLSKQVRGNAVSDEESEDVTLGRIYGWKDHTGLGVGEQGRK